MSLEHAVLSLSGLSVGDAFGKTLYSPVFNEVIKDKRLPSGPWMWTDDTHMALSVVEELRQRSWIDQDYLARRMAWRFSTDPARGYGATTRKVLQQIGQGEYFRTISRSIYNGGSYGCSGVSRVVPLGAYYAKAPAKAAREAPLATAITHIHPESLAGAQAVAAAAAIAADPIHPSNADFLREVIEYVAESRVRQAIKQITAIPSDDLQSCLKYLCCDSLNTVQTAVPFALWCAAHHLEDYQEALWCAVSGSGSRDTTCAIVGGIVALSSGMVPEDWTACREPLPITTLLHDIDRVQPRAADLRKPVKTKFLPQKTIDSTTMISARVDPLTNLPNMLGLLEWADKLEEKPECFPLSLIIIHLLPLWDVNRIAGRTSGDNLLRESAQILQKINIGPVFRAGGDKFVIIPQEGSQSLVLAEKISHLMAVSDCRLPRIALIHFPYKEEIVDGRLVACMGEAMKDKHYRNNDGSPREFDATTIRALPDFSWMMLDLASQLRRLGEMVDAANRLAQTDVVSQLPNQRTAMLALESTLQQAVDLNESMAIMLFDGDNLRQYNDVSYEAGDEAIRLMGSTLKGLMRDSDYLARWRTGDEFLFILPGTDAEVAMLIANRVCSAVQEASKSWMFRTTISGGVSTYKHGRTVQDMIDVAEKALHQAKIDGRNRAVLGE
jgi:diguanylate cyclase (GGDEF)-like protein